MAGTVELEGDTQNAISEKVPIPTGGVTAGEVLAFGADGAIGFVASSVVEATTTTELEVSEVYTIFLKAPRALVNKDGNAASQGDAMYWTGTAFSATASTGNAQVGFFRADATASETTAKAYFDGLKPAGV